MTRCDGLPAHLFRFESVRATNLWKRIEKIPVSLIGRLIPNEESIAIGTGRQINATVFVLDICNWSSRPSWTKEEQEVNLKVMHLFFSSMIRIAERYDGFVEKNTGDGLFAYFQDPPLALNSSATKAAACAMTMMAINEYTIKPLLQQTRLQPVQFRISIEHGPITIALIGAARRFNSLVAIGSCANFASKMLSKAKAGEIVIGDGAVEKLPENWRNQFVMPLPEQTGWTRRLSDNVPYPAHLYTGRWSRLV